MRPLVAGSHLAHGGPDLTEMPPSGDPAHDRPIGDAPPPGLLEQLRRTIASIRRLIDAHVTLAKAELAAIVGELKRVAIQLSLALAMLLFVGVLVPVGTTLFLGEWLFGSIGWGVLLGAELCIAVAVAFVLGALEISIGRLVGGLVVAIVLASAVAAVLGFGLVHEGWTRVGDAAFGGVVEGNRPLVAAFVCGAVVIGVLAALAGLRGGIGGFIGGLVTGAVVGALVGAFTAISFTGQVAAAIGTAVTLALWPAFSAMALRGYDWSRMKSRFMPSTTIDTAQETLEWLKQIRP